jgi:hypothetical protein
MKIKKTILGEEFIFKLKPIVNSKNIVIRILGTDKEVIGIINDDYTYILLPDDYKTPYITGHGYVSINRLKINKHLKIDLEDYGIC